MKGGIFVEVAREFLSMKNLERMKLNICRSIEEGGDTEGLRDPALYCLERLKDTAYRCSYSKIVKNIQAITKEVEKPEPDKKKIELFFIQLKDKLEAVVNKNKQEAREEWPSLKKKEQEWWEYQEQEQEQI